MVNQSILTSTRRELKLHWLPSVPQVGFEHTTLAFERAKTIHALGHAATLICKFPN
jgi:hypothetical protein